MEIKNGQAVQIQLRTKIQQAELVEEFTYDLPGQMIQKADTVYLRYIEPKTAEQPAVPVTVKISADGNVQIIRASEMRLKLQFALNETLETNCHTPYGMMFFSTETKHLQFSQKETQGALQMTYDLANGAETVGTYELDLTYIVE